MWKTRRDFWLFVFPGLSIYAVFFLLPIAQSLWFSFHQWPGFGSSQFVGLANFVSLARDFVLWISLQNTLLFILLSFAGMLPLSFLLANSIARLSPSPSAAVYSILIFLPCIISSVSVAMMWEMLLQRHTGAIPNTTLYLFGTKGPNWFGNPNLAIYTVIFVNTWQWTGLSMLIFSAAIKNVPKELYEAAEIDGAGPMQQMLWVTIPMVSRTIMINMLLIAFGSLRAFDLIFILTAGGPIDSSQMPSLYMYQLTFMQYQFGPGNALAVIIFLLAIISYVGIKIFFLAIKTISFASARMNQTEIKKHEKGFYNA